MEGVEKMKRTKRWAVLAAGVAVAASAGMAAETVVYSYDARGRLVKVERSGSVNNNVVTNYTFDKADNRTAKSTSGSANPPPP
jgi:predicted lipoprotein with Yx(FWY)xxD motif